MLTSPVLVTLFLVVVAVLCTPGLLLSAKYAIHMDTSVARGHGYMYTQRLCRPHFFLFCTSDLQEFDASAVPEPTEPVYRVAAAGAVNIHPLARTFKGLVPVSLDAPPPRRRRKGKQVRT